MGWLVVVFIGVLAGASLGISGSWWRARRHLRRVPGAFACKVRELNGAADERFPLRAATGWWVGGVLAVHGRTGVAITRLLPVAASDHVRPLGVGVVRGLGPAPRSLLLIVQDGRLFEVAVAAVDANLLAGPLMARHPQHRH